MIEDATNGIQAAHNAGMPVVAMTTTLTKEQLATANPTYLVDTYAEVEALVKSLLG